MSAAMCVRVLYKNIQKLECNLKCECILKFECNLKCECGLKFE